MSDAGVSERSGQPPRVLIVDDDEQALRMWKRAISAESPDIEISMTSNPLTALQLVANEEFEVIISDVFMPEMTGLEFIENLRKVDLDLPVILMTGTPSDSTARRAVELGAHAYCVKPPDIGKLITHIDQAALSYKVAALKRRVAAISGYDDNRPGDLAGMEQAFNDVLSNIRLAFQPVVSTNDLKLLGYEALIRTSNPRLPTVLSVIEASVSLGATRRLLDAVLDHIETVTFPDDAVLFLNVLPEDLPCLVEMVSAGRLAGLRERTTLELSERLRLERLPALEASVSKLRDFGMKFAIDDFGTGMAGVVNFAALHPEYVKVDHELIKDLSFSAQSRAVVGALLDICQLHDIRVIAEGVETNETIEACSALGFDFVQGFYIEKPSFRFEYSGVEAGSQTG